MQPFIEHLINQSRAQTVQVDEALDAALAQLDALLAQLAGALRVEYYGPEIGVGAGRHVYRLVVRAHEWEINNPTWSLKVCTALPHAGWRADWAVQGVARQRKALVVQALPAFFDGYATAIAAAGEADTPAGRQVVELARVFAPR
jgi:hypothetical protein